MCPGPLDGSAEDGLTNSLLRFVEDGQIVALRHALSDFNHRCRNLLNGMKMSFYLAKRSAPGPLSPRWDELDQTYRSVEQLLERLSSIYRSMPLNLVSTPFGALAAEREDAWRGWFEQAGDALTLAPPVVEEAGELDAMRLVSALDGFIAWRAESMPRGSRAKLAWSTENGWIEIVWREQTPEAPPADPAPARRSTPSGMGSLSLPLLARVVAEHQGRLSWTREPRAEARGRWPLTISTPAPAHADKARAVAVH